MRQETITVYTFDELPTEKAKERARDWWRQSGLDYDWWDAVYEDCSGVFRILGIESKRRVTGRDGKIRDAGPEIYFSGFSSQGDGACFAGRYRYAKGATRAIREYAPDDTALHDIADRLQDLQRKHFYGVECSITHSHRYCHEYAMNFEVWDRDRDASEETHDALREIMRDLARWIYRSLEREYEHLNSDEAVDETLVANEYDFTEDGSLHN